MIIDNMLHRWTNGTVENRGSATLCGVGFASDVRFLCRAIGGPLRELIWFDVQNDLNLMLPSLDRMWTCGRTPRSSSLRTPPWRVGQAKPHALNECIHAHPRKQIDRLTTPPHIHTYTHTARSHLAPPRLTDGGETALLPQKLGPFAFLLPDEVDETDPTDRPAELHLDFHVCSAVSARSFLVSLVYADGLFVEWEPERH